MKVCNNCHNNYCESCGSNNTCTKGCENFRHTVMLETYGKEFTLISHRLCCKCFADNDLSVINRKCNKDCIIFTTISKSMTYWNCRQHKP